MKLNFKLLTTLLAMGVLIFGISSCGDDEDDVVKTGGQFAATPSLNVIVMGSTITFTDASTEVESLLWNFEGGDKEISTAQTVDVKYETPGKYSASLNIKYVGGLREFKEYTITVLERAVSFSVNSNVAGEGVAIEFTDNSAGSPTSWEWTFEGGTPATSTEQNPIVTWDLEGTYDVTLTINSASLGVNTYTAEDFVEIKPNVKAEFGADNIAILAGESVTFEDQSTESPNRWLWEFAGGDPSTSEEQNPTVTYPEGGVFKVTLTAYREGDVVKSEEIKEGFIRVGEILPCADATNLVGCGNNDGSSDDITEWFATNKDGGNSQRLVVDPDNGNSGSGCIKYTRNNGDGADNIIFKAVQFDVPAGGGDYKLDYAVYVDNYSNDGTGSAFVIEPSFRPTDTESSEAHKGWTQRVGQLENWQTHDLTKTLPEGSYFIGFKIYNGADSPNSTYDMCFDDLTVTQL